MNDEGFIKLHRKMLGWEWYADPNTKALFIHAIFKANWKDGKYMGVDIPRGSFVASYSSLCRELGLSKQELRTAIKHLKSTQELTQEQHSKFSVFTVVNYNLYQEVNTDFNTQPTQSQHTYRRINKNIRNIEEERESARAYGIHNNVYLTDQEMDELIKAYPGEYQDMIENLSTYMRSKGKVYGDHYATMMKWKREDAEKKRQQADTYDYRKDVI